jgi:transcription initiation factor IIF auxiliary subunit
MSLRVAQDQRYVEEDIDWWEWSIWIEGPDEELDEVKEVTYKLHPTFKKPLRTIDDRASKFKLESEGWGVFPIRVKVELKNGVVIKLVHELQLFYPDGTPNTK